MPALLLAVASHLVSKSPQRCICTLHIFHCHDDDGGGDDNCQWQADLKLLICVLKPAPKLFKLRSEARGVAANENVIKSYKMPHGLVWSLSKGKD